MYNIKEEGRSDNSLKGMKKASRDCLCWPMGNNQIDIIS